MILGLLGRALFSVEFTFDPTTVDWENLYKEARAQTVDLLLFDALTEQERQAIPQKNAAEWQSAAFQALRYNEQLHYEQGCVLRALEQAMVPCVILKGFSCAINYPNPSLRCAGDIDVLVGIDDIECARKALEERGYIASPEPHPFHLHMHNGWKIVELHHEPAGIPRGDIGDQIRAFFRGSERKAEKVDALPVLPLREQAVTLILHKLEHIVTSGLGLRQMYDWAMFVYVQLSAEKWRSVEPVLREFGLLHFTKVVTRICVEELRLPETAAPWCMDIDKGVADQLLADILRTGNFGRKENRYGQRLFTDANSGNRLTSFVRVGTQACRNHWPVCEKYPVLLPLAPFVLLNRYRKHRKNGTRQVFKPYSLYKSAKDRQALYSELQPFIREN